VTCVIEREGEREREREREKCFGFTNNADVQTTERGGRNLSGYSGVLPSAHCSAGRWQMEKGGPTGAAGTAAPKELTTERKRSVACRLRAIAKQHTCVFACGKFVRQRFGRCAMLAGGSPGAGGKSGCGCPLERWGGGEQKYI